MGTSLVLKLYFCSLCVKAKLTAKTHASEMHDVAKIKHQHDTEVKHIETPKAGAPPKVSTVGTALGFYAMYVCIYGTIHFLKIAGASLERH